MTKSRQSNKETRKQPNLNLKEKRAARRSKKDTQETVQPIIPR